MSETKPRNASGKPCQTARISFKIYFHGLQPGGIDGFQQKYSSITVSFAIPLQIWIHRATFPGRSASEQTSHKKWKIMISDSLIDLECSDCAHTLQASSTRELYKFWEFEAILMTLSIIFLIFMVGDQLTPAKCYQYWRGWFSSKFRSQWPAHSDRLVLKLCVTLLAPLSKSSSRTVDICNWMDIWYEIRSETFINDVFRASLFSNLKIIIYPQDINSSHSSQSGKSPISLKSF